MLYMLNGKVLAFNIPYSSQGICYGRKKMSYIFIFLQDRNCSVLNQAKMGLWFKSYSVPCASPDFDVFETIFILVYISSLFRMCF